jgi:hypothetical protein
MPDAQNSEGQVSIPFYPLVRAIDQLPTEALLQLLHVTETALAGRASAQPEGQMAQVEDEKFWESELGQYILAEADASISIEHVRQALSVIPGSLTTEISRERDER